MARSKGAKVKAMSPAEMQALTAEVRAKYGDDTKPGARDILKVLRARRGE